ncbi:MAG: transposase [Bacteroidetes bacterium]|nr:transposase [Bacteroidota bacterium]
MESILTEKQWAVLKKVLPEPKGRHSKNDRNFIEAVLWIQKNGAPWRSLPKGFGSWKTIYNRFRRWQLLGYWEEILRRCQKKTLVADVRNLLMPLT